VALTFARLRPIARRKYLEKSLMPSRAATEHRYEKLTWPEINDAIEMGKVCVMPCGAVEQHGPHLPLDVDMI
jgi:creatinine amidohydrolase